MANPRLRAYPHAVAMSSAEFAVLSTIIHDHTGIVTGPQKRDMIYGRLIRRLRALGMDSFSAYLSYLQGPEGQQERGLMINAVTTNLTGFFREKHHFDYFEAQVLPELVAKHRNTGRRLRVWSAGCSSGEEPYSIAMTMNEVVPNIASWDARILATDIDSDVLNQARAGNYEVERLAAIPRRFRQHFMKNEAGDYEIPRELKSLIAFKHLNLLGPWPMKGSFDVVFCRNVVIYFDKDTQRILFERFADIIAPGGWLFVGHSESLYRVTDRFELIGRTIYRKLSHD